MIVRLTIEELDAHDICTIDSLFVEETFLLADSLGTKIQQGMPVPPEPFYRNGNAAYAAYSSLLSINRVCF